MKDGKIQITVNLNEFYYDGDSNIEEGLKKYITNQVVKEIFKTIESKVKAQIEMEVKELVQKLMYSEITSFIKQYIGEGKIKSRNSNNEITMKEYIGECFRSGSNWQSFEGVISEQMKKYVDELKKRYDLLFASQIVIKLGEQKLLKEEVIDILLKNNPKDKN